MDAEVDRRDAGNHADALARAAAAGDSPGRAGPVATRDIDQEEVRTHPVAVPAVAPGAARRGGIRNLHGVGRILRPPVHRPRIPAQHAFLRAGFGNAERRLDAALVFTDPLLLGPSEERSSDQRPNDDEREDRNCERHAALITQNPTHTVSLEVFWRFWRMVEDRGGKPPLPSPTCSNLHQPAVQNRRLLRNATLVTMLSTIVAAAA